MKRSPIYWSGFYCRSEENQWWNSVYALVVNVIEITLTKVEVGIPFCEGGSTMVFSVVSMLPLYEPFSRFFCWRNSTNNIFSYLMTYFHMKLCPVNIEIRKYCPLIVNMYFRLHFPLTLFYFQFYIKIIFLKSRNMNILFII